MVFLPVNLSLNPIQPSIFLATLVLNHQSELYNWLGLIAELSRNQPSRIPPVCSSKVVCTVLVDGFLSFVTSNSNECLPVLVLFLEIDRKLVFFAI